MSDRFRIEIYDENKANDLTIYSEQGVDQENFRQLVFSYLPKFQGNVKAYVYDELNKRKTVALYYPVDSRIMLRSAK